MMLQMDFAESYTCTAQDEVQSAHWKQNQVRLNTSVAWFNTLPHVSVSDNLKHDKYAIVVFITEVLKHKLEGVHLLKVWTHRPNSQFKKNMLWELLKCFQKDIMLE